MRLVKLFGLIAAAFFASASANADIIGVSSVLFSDVTAASCANFSAICNFSSSDRGTGLKAQGKLFDLPNLTSPLDLGTVTIAGSSGSEFLDLKTSFSQSDGTTVDVYFTGVSDVHRGFEAITATVDFGSPKTFQLDGERLALDIAPISLSIDVGLPGGNHPLLVGFDANTDASGPLAGLSQERLSN